VSERVNAWVVPAYIMLCIVLGGSSVRQWENSVLQLAGVVVIGWVVASARAEPTMPRARPLLAIAIATLILVIAQLVPLSPSIWKSLPGRDPIALGFAALGYSSPSLPLSLAPHRTLESAYGLIPPLAAFMAIVALRAHSERAVAGIVLAGALLSVLLAALQVSSGSSQAWVHLYENVSPGAVGFFANRNHMATLLLVAVPFSAALIAAGHPHIQSRTTAFALAALGTGSLLLIAIGLILNGSLAAMVLAAPVIAFSVLLLPILLRFRRMLVPFAALAFLASAAMFATSWIGSDVATVETDSLYSRGQIWDLTLRAIADSFPLGTGLGTFSGVYALQEDPAAVTVAWVNHAHNDFLELLLETGLPGLILILTFLGWFALQTARVWRSPFSTLFAKASTIAAAVILAHSVVDYPLRTASIAAIFGACLGMMTGPPRQGRSDEAKHVRIA
jgi:O-antigen ligase